MGQPPGYIKQSTSDWINHLCSHQEKYRKAEYIQRRVCFVNVQSPLYENVVFFAHISNAAYIIFIMWNTISGLDAWYHFFFQSWWRFHVEMSSTKNFVGG